MLEFLPLEVDALFNTPTDDFFVGIGDINSTFLPKLDPSTATIPQISPATPDQQPPTAPGSITSIPALGPLPDNPPSSVVNASTADEEEAKEILEREMIARNSLALEAQVEERPLAKLQEELQEAANGELASETPASHSASSESEDSKPPEAPGEKHHRKALLKNDDTELQRVKRVSCGFPCDMQIPENLLASGRCASTILRSLQRPTSR
jgi:RNA polymerase II subunit A-like phosphatase